MAIFRFKKQKLGQGFSDFLSEETKSVRKDRENKPQFKRAYAILLCFVGFVILSGRLFFLTIVRGDYYRDLSENNRIREERLDPPRGVIYDRWGNILARNTPIQKKCERKDYSYLCQFLSREKAIEAEAKGEKITLSLGREYPASSISAHLVGYLRETSSSNLEEENNGYFLGDLIGATGAEEAFEKKLRGILGKRLIEVDAYEKEVRELARIEPQEGENIYLSVDLKLQKKAAELLAGKKGAIIASNPKTGEIFVLYSSPSFDPNIFAAPDNFKEVSKIINDPDKPLFNRAISGTYPPGSTFKIVTAVSALEEKRITENTKIEDTGKITVGQFSFSNWYFTQYGKTEGEINIVRAIARSNDIFFYKMGELVGEEKLIKWARRFKLETKLGIELDSEAEGLIRENRKLYLGDLYHLAIGQGDLSVTPLQVNFWTAAIANEGKICKPTIQKNLETDCEDLKISKKTIELVKEGMRQACSPGGTGWPLFNFKIQNSKFKIDDKNYIDSGNGYVEIPVACKTGTSEFGDPDNKTHAWLTAFAPVEKPEIVVTVLIEGGGEGSTDAGPLVKEMLKAYYNDESG